MIHIRPKRLWRVLSLFKTGPFLRYKCKAQEVYHQSNSFIHCIFTNIKLQWYFKKYIPALLRVRSTFSPLLYLVSVVFNLLLKSTHKMNILLFFQECNIMNKQRLFTKSIKLLLSTCILFWFILNTSILLFLYTPHPRQPGVSPYSDSVAFPHFIPYEPDLKPTDINGL